MTTIMEEVKNGLVFGPRRMEGKGGDSVQVGSADLNSIYLSMRHARHTPAPSRPLQTDWTGLDWTGQDWTRLADLRALRTGIEHGHFDYSSASETCPRGLDLNCQHLLMALSFMSLVYL
jgi:hypothetical protein